MASIISGLGSGVDLQAIVTQLMTAERAPEQKMLALKSAAQSAQTGWSNLRGYLTSLTTAAGALSTTTKAAAASATTSDATSLTATAAAGAATGTVTLGVTQLATAQQLTTGALTGPGMLVGAGTATITAGLTSIGATRLQLDSTITAGTHTVQVTQASAAASAQGTAAPSLSFGGADLTVTTASGTKTFTLADATSTTDLVSQLNTQLSGVASASIVAGQLRIASLDEGSDAALTLAGSALGSLGLTAGTTNGTDAKVSWDGTSTTLTHVTAGGTATLATGVTLTTGAHLAQGKATSMLVSTTATSTVADLAYVLNTSGSPAAAAVIDTGDGSSTPSRLVLTATGTGTAGSLTFESSGINVLGTGQLSTVTAAQDAKITIGGTTLTRSSNSVSDLMPGVTLGLLKTGTNLIVGVNRDAAATSKLVSDLVGSVNALLSNVKSQTSYNATTKTSGPLAGDSGAMSIAGGLLERFGSVTGTGTTKVLSQLGIQTSRDGTLAFDSTKFTAALAADPDGVTSLISTFASKLETYGKSLTAVDGAVALGAKNASEEISRRQGQIDAFEVRMTQKQKAYSAKFAALDAALGTLRQQQSRLSSQISGLSSG